MTTGWHVDDIDPSTLEERPFPGAAPLRVLVDEVAHSAVWSHAFAGSGGDEPAEVGGVLVGQVYRDAAGPFVHVKAAIAAQHTRSEGTEVTFTPDSWQQINHDKDERYPNDRIVGWYHTHPTFGVFLSERDKFIHRHSFPQSWAVALVVDPIQGQEGFFAWKGDEPTPLPEHWVGSTRRVPSTPMDREAVPLAPGGTAPGLVSGGLRWTFAVVALALGVGAAVGIYLRDAALLREERNLIARALASERLELDAALQALRAIRTALDKSRCATGAGDGSMVRAGLNRAEIGLKRADMLALSLLQVLLEAGEDGQTVDSRAEAPAPDQTASPQHRGQ